MSTNGQRLLMDAAGKPIPQYYDSVADVFVAISDATPMPINTGSRVAQALMTAAVTPETGNWVATKGASFSVAASGTTTAGAGAATVVVEGSHDGTVPVTLATISLVLGTVLASDGFGSAVPYRYVRARLSAISGTGASINVTLGA